MRCRFLFLQNKFHFLSGLTFSLLGYSKRQLVIYFTKLLDRPDGLTGSLVSRPDKLHGLISIRGRFFVIINQLSPEEPGN